jgi:hypothetical protein
LKKRRNLILWVFLVTLIVTYGTALPPASSSNNKVVAPPKIFNVTRNVCAQMHEKGQDIHPVFCHVAIGFIEVLAGASEE